MDDADLILIIQNTHCDFDSSHLAQYVYIFRTHLFHKVNMFLQDVKILTITLADLPEI